jgi:propionate catabolism activator/DDE superfamily endonuclease
MCAGMIPILHCPGVITPGQFGPRSRTPGLSSRKRFTFTMSRTGMPSVMATMSGMPAPAASRIASGACSGGTKMQVDALETARSLTEADERVDAFVAAGSNGTYLRDHAPVPVALVNVSTTDALQALAHARTLGRRIGVVNFRRVLPGLERWKDLLRGVQIEQRARVTPEEARAAVAELAAQGYEVVVGSGPACEVADAAGLKSVSAGAQILYLPPYHPKLNLIELAWSKLKALLKAIGARDRQVLAAALKRSKDLLTPSDMEGWFRHCGYEVLAQCA